MNGKVVIGLLIGTGVLVAGFFGVKFIIEKKQEDEMMKELEKEYQARNQTKKLNSGDDTDIFTRPKEIEMVLTEEEAKEAAENFDMNQLKLDEDILQEGTA